MVLMVVYLLAGFALLVKGADYFVDGACNLSKKLKIPEYLVGLTVVAFGTSLPEAAVSITASVQGSNEIAIGNVIGSNTFNTLFILGASALFTPVVVKKNILKHDFPFCLGITGLLLVLLLSLNNGKIALTYIDGIVLLVIFAVFMTVSIINGRKDTKTVQEEVPVSNISNLKCVAMILFGLAGVVLGGQLTVRGATLLARAFGMSETVIGLTVVAVGTSLPELVTSIVAARKKQNDIAVGNVIGSNIFNILFILGVSSCITTIPTDNHTIMDICILIGGSLLVYLFSVTSKKITRYAAVIMILLYIGYTAYLLIR